MALPEPERGRPAPPVERVNQRKREPSTSYERAFVAGMLGAAAMSVLISLGFWMNWSLLRLETLLGSLITGRDYGFDTWAAGFLWHLINGGLFALVYQAIFKAAGRAGPALGALIGIGHWIVAGFLLPLVFILRPLIIGPDVIADLFVWATWGGATFFGSLVLHLVYGAIVGTLCRRRKVWIEDRVQTAPERRVA